MFVRVGADDARVPILTVIDPIYELHLQLYDRTIIIYTGLQLYASVTQNNKPLYTSWSTREHE